MCIICCGIGVDETVVHRSQQICEINIHWQGKIDHNICFMLLFVQKSRTFWLSLCFGQELRSCVGLVAPDKSTLRKVYFTTLLSAMMEISYKFTLPVM